MSFTIIYSSQALKEDAPFLDSAVLERIEAAIRDKLVRDPVRFGKPLRHDWAGARSLWVGDYRIIYEIDVPGKIVTIRTFGHRRYIYKQ